MWLGLCVGIVVLAAPALAAAVAPSGSGTLTDVANAYKLTSAGWISTALGYAQHLFFALVAIEIAWTGITYLLQRDSLSDFVAQLVLKLMGVFFFLALLQNAPTWMPYIINSFSQAGSTISGGGVVLDPSSMFGEGLKLAKSMLGTLSSPSFFTAIVAVLISVLSAIGVVIAFAVVAGQLMVTLIESYIVISAGIFFLGFSGSRWTLPFSEKYVAYAVSVGIKLFMLYLIVGLGETLASKWATLFTPGTVATPDVYIGVAGSALIFMLLGWHIPGLAASLMNGSPIMTLGTAASTVSTTVTGGLAVASAGLAAAGALGASGVAAAASLVGARANPKKFEQVQEAASPTPVGVISGDPSQANIPATQNRQVSSQVGIETAAGHTTTAGGRTNSEQTSDSVSHDPAATGDGDNAPNSPTSDDHSAGATSPAPLREETQLPTPPSQEIPRSRTTRTSGPTGLRPRHSILDILRNIRPPAFPNDAGGGTIHIRFKHHDSE